MKTEEEYHFARADRIRRVFEVYLADGKVMQSLLLFLHCMAFPGERTAL